VQTRAAVAAAAAEEIFFVRRQFQTPRSVASSADF